MDQLEREFNRAMRRIYVEAKRDLHYNATRFLEMLDREGGLATARGLLWSEKPSDGFTVLWEKRRLDLSVEAHIVDPTFEALFSEADRERALDRLEQYDWTTRRKQPANRGSA